MSRIIKTESVGKERKQLVRAVVLAIRELSQKTELDESAKDIAAFISITLITIYSNVNHAVSAWEKRGYWVKADRFRLEWEWCKSQGDGLKEAVINNEWEEVIDRSTQIAIRLSTAFHKFVPSFSSSFSTV